MAPVPEQTDLAVVLWIGGVITWRRGVQQLLGATDNNSVVELHLMICRNPYVAGYCAMREYEPTRGGTIQDVNNGGIASLVRCHVHIGKGNAIGSRVVVDSQVCKAFTCTVDSAAPNKVGSKHSMSALTGYMIYPIGGQK